MSFCQQRIFKIKLNFEWQFWGPSIHGQKLLIISGVHYKLTSDLKSVSSGKLATWLLGEFAYQGLDGGQSNRIEVSAAIGEDGVQNYNARRL
jgi:hypothetical protein